MIKRLSKEVIAEGLTVDFVNSINMGRNYSPVQLQKGDEPVEILECSTGYWVMYESGKYLKDEKGKLMVFSEKDCRIGRARYLLNFGEAEKKRKVAALVASWKGEIRERIDTMKRQANGYVPGGLVGMMLLDMKGEGERERLANNAQKAYEAAEQLWGEGKFIELMEALDIKHFSNPMLSANIENDEQMRVVVNTFGAKALDEWDGDILNRYAAIEIEKQYTF